MRSQFIFASLVAAATVAVALAPTAGHAQTLASGATIIPTATLTGSPGTFLNSVTTTQTVGTLANPLTFTARSAVYRNTSNTLDFYYQVANSSTSNDTISRFTASPFGSFATSIFYRTDDFDGAGIFTAGTSIASTVDRGANGNVVGANFGTTPIPVGSTSFTLIVRTNATDYQTGQYAVIDGSATTVNGFAPKNSPVPEPASLALAATGLVGLLGGVLRRRRSA